MAGNKKEEQSIYFPTAREWRDWLSRNHDKETEVWLIYYKRDTGKPTITYNEALDEALCYGWIDGRTKSLDEERYMFRYSPRKAGSRWSKTNKDRAEQLVKEGRMAAPGLAAIEEARKNGAWDAAYSTGHTTDEEVPEDLEAALVGNEAAHGNFHAFARSYRNNYIRWLNSAKTEPTRLKRIGIIVERSADNIKPGMDL